MFLDLRAEEHLSVVKSNLLFRLLDQGSFEITLHFLFPALDILLMTSYREHCGISFSFDYAERNQLDCAESGGLKQLQLDLTT